MGVLRRVFTVVIVLGFSALLPGAEIAWPARIWQPRSSADVEAKLVSQTDVAATVLQVDGKQLTFKKTELSTEDLRFLVNAASAVNEMRDWTLKAGPEGNHGKKRPGETQSVTFKGSFVGVTGFDSPLSKSYVVLIHDDGRRKAYVLKDFSEADQAYVAGRQGQAASGKSQANAADEDYPLIKVGGYDPAKDKGTFNEHRTKHFRFLWGNKTDGDGKRWADPKFRQMNFDYYERIWDFDNHVLHAPMPYARDSQKYKINVYVTGTGLTHHKDGWAFGAEAIVIHPGAMLEGSSVIPHEFGHALQFYSGGFRNSPYVGWFWECHANWTCHQFIPSYPPVLDGYSNCMHYELASSRMNYGSWPFLQYMAEHPRIGPGFCYDIWLGNRKDSTDHSIEDPFQTCMRVGVEKGVFAGDGNASFADIIGEMAAHNVAWDYVGQRAYQEVIRNLLQWTCAPARFRVMLQGVADRPGFYRPIYSHAPREYGVNIVDLVRQVGADKVEVDFQGIVDEVESSDWRLTIVAMDDQGRCRYSRMWNTGKQSMTLKPGETRLALAIAATPRVHRNIGFRPGFNRIRRFPYEVAFAGCTPAVEPLMTHMDKGAGKPHPNGGGFVAVSAKVAPSAYVGPSAMVLHVAQVSDNARIEGHAVIANEAKVSGNAVVGGYAVLKNRAQASGSARVGGWAAVNDSVKVADNARVLEYVSVFGDGQIGGQAMVKGFGTVNTSKSAEICGDVVMGEDLEVHMNSWKKGPLNYGLIYGFNTADQFERERPDVHGLYALWDFSRPRKSVLCDSIADNDGVLRGGAAIVADGNRNVLTLSGVGQYALVEGLAAETVDITIDMQLKWDGGETMQRVFDFGSAEGSMLFTPKDSDGKAAFVIRKGTTVQSVQAGSALPAGKWVRVTIIRKDGDARVYIDGVQAGKSAAMTLRPEDVHATAGFLGSGMGGKECFRGQLGELAVYRKAFEDARAIPGRGPKAESAKSGKRSGKP